LNILRLTALHFNNLLGVQLVTINDDLLLTHLMQGFFCEKHFIILFNSNSKIIV